MAAGPDGAAGFAGQSLRTNMISCVFPVGIPLGTVSFLVSLKQGLKTDRPSSTRCRVASFVVAFGFPLTASQQGHNLWFPAQPLIQSSLTIMRSSNSFPASQTATFLPFTSDALRMSDSFHES